MRRAALSFYRRLPLATRLALLFGAAAALVFACAGFHLYDASAEQLRRRDDQALKAAAELLKHHIEEIRDLDALRRDPHYLLDVALAQRGLAFAIRTQQGELVTTSAREAVSLEGKTAGTARSPIEFSDGTTRDGKPLRLAVLEAQLGNTRDQVQLVVAHEDTQRQAILRAYRTDLIWTTLLGAMVTGLLGYAIARHGLRNIKRIAHASGKITASHLDKRLPLEDAPPELEEMVHAFNQMLDRLEDSFRRLRQFSSDIAHDLRTPISNLMVETQVMLSQPRTTAEYQNLLGSNIEELERLARMVEEMLFLARVDDPSTMLEKKDVDLAAELDKVIEFYTPLAQEKNLSIGRAGEGHALGDRRLLQRAIHNLISNAVRYSDRNSVIQTQVSSTPASEVELKIANPGPGIPPEHLPHVFDRFYRTDSAREKSADGAGLGLAIVKSIIELHGGRIEVTSRPGEVTTFTVHLPATLPHQ